ncbi:FadR/GntR family transcriptional regulator [Dinoroseobacter sp. PD6]|uniref:FadR/GntR family transcriptional regulator n=1 Tax=Dinoroseobacter sp. PD6 TaxID=3028384 RepID=UPI00237B3B6A|nr:FadR/GntR family transcriptional regulator [Dinoroseobacter sp. PD6]MDD9717762.1 FadR/GntR family transcriptional regulator [Dinoroseobacter sp. PD6]
MAQAKELVSIIRQLIAEKGYKLSDRLPPERELCKTLGVSRHILRNALIEMEKSGLIWRHVGRGTFVGPRPILNLDDVLFLRDLVTPAQVVTVRFTIEPELSRLAASHATRSDCDRMKQCADRCREAEDWRTYEAWDNNLHHAIARAARNQLFLYFFETLNSVRRSIVWGQARETRKPEEGYVSFRQHDDIVAAIAEGDGDRAARCMIRHLETVYADVLRKGVPRDT